MAAAGGQAFVRASHTVAVGMGPLMLNVSETVEGQTWAQAVAGNSLQNSNKSSSSLAS